MNSNCRMNRFSNCEICYRWYQLCIRVQYTEVLEEIFKFLGSTCRMKYLKVMYSEFKSSWPEMMTRVNEFFLEHQKYMHPIAIKQIEIRLWNSFAKILSRDSLSTLKQNFRINSTVRTVIEIRFQSEEYLICELCQRWTECL